MQKDVPRDVTYLKKGAKQFQFLDSVVRLTIVPNRVLTDR